MLNSASFETGSGHLLPVAPRRSAWPAGADRRFWETALEALGNFSASGGCRKAPGEEASGRAEAGSRDGLAEPRALSVAFRVRPHRPPGVPSTCVCFSLRHSRGRSSG